MSNILLHIFLQVAFAVLASAVFKLEPYSTLYLPSAYDGSGNPMYEYGGDAIEDAAYDAMDEIVYTAGR